MIHKEKNENGRGTTIVERFDNIATFYNAMENRTVQPAFEGYEASHKTSRYRLEFTGTKDYKSATELLLQGDRENAEKVLNQVAAIKRQVGKETQRRRVGTGVVGFAPNVPAFLAGVPRAMITATPSKRKEKIINIVYNIACPWTVERETIQKAVINLAGAIVALEAGGARVNVYATYCVSSSSGGHKTGVFVRVKNSNQPLDTLKMIYPLGHPSMTRRHAFRWLETANIPSAFRTGYGSYLDRTEVGPLCTNAGVKCDRVLNYEVASENDYKALAKMIDTGVII